ncbi:HI1506-related protein [Algiphilus sp.]|uniref:HI1506-related protein n=1 Tax=Algiphilus sp. TaxID=1872431 RepID=UPI0025BE6D54|nr:HI1506-related protein [Algiphilus sp.]MCK5772041.1 hypothetical protein [Algiphilus sp.]
MATIYRITAHRDGHRRAGMAHSTKPVDHPADRFTKAQLEQLRADPRLVVQEVEVKDDGGDGSDSGEGGAAAKKAAAKKAATKQAGDK